MRRRLLQAIFGYLRMNNGEFNFDVFDPVPRNDPVWGKPNKGVFTIFNAGRDDRDFVIRDRAKFDVVADGNQPLKRKLETGEHTSKRLAGKPRSKVRSSRRSTSRCQAVDESERIAFSRTRTGGIFAT
eukprot:9399054-Alexandrium_andersonii.AAC.1